MKPKSGNMKSAVCSSDSAAKNVINLEVDAGAIEFLQRRRVEASVIASLSRGAVLDVEPVAKQLDPGSIPVSELRLQ